MGSALIVDGLLWMGMLTIIVPTLLVNVRHVIHAPAMGVVNNNKKLKETKWVN